MPESSVLNEQDKALFRAISNDNLEGVQEALDGGANPNASEGHHHTALSRAIVSDNSKIVGHLLDRGADPNARSGSGETPLHYGHSASREVRDQLLTAGANPNGFDKIGQTPLHLAAGSERCLETTQQLLAAGADPNARTESGRTPLHGATDRPVVERLLRWGADPNAADKHGATPLHDAVSNPDTPNQVRFERVTQLLNAGADPNARTDQGETPLHRAASHLRDSYANIRQLLDAKADPRAKDAVGNTPLHYAAGKSSVDRGYTVEELIERGASGREQNKAGNTPLHYAARSDGEGQARAVTTILKNDRGIDIRNAEGKTPVDVATPTAQEIFARRYNSPEQKERRAMNDRAEKQAPNKPNKADEYHQKFADQIVEQIRQGNAPWQKPWKPGEDNLPKNLSSGKEYRGGNSVYLSVSQGAKGYSDNRWGTYKQIQAAGGQVRKGERGTRILSFQDHRQIAVTDKAGKPVHDAEGKKVYRHERMDHPMVRQYTVFNADQADGLKLPERPAKQPEWKAHENAEIAIRESGVRINHVPGDQACYNLGTDRVTLPERGQFATAIGYYQTALHELGHASGHESRLNRKSLQEGVAAGFGSEAYAKEELRAEISAMMTGQRVGVGHDGSRGAAYVDNWIKVLNKEPREIYHAASEAQKISDYLVAPVRERAAEQEKKQEELAQKFSHEAGPQISHSPSPQAKAKAQEMERDAGPSR